MKIDRSKFSPQHQKFLLNKKRQSIAVRLWQVGVLVIFLGIWELLAQVGAIDSFITSCPSKVAVTFWELTVQGTLWRHVLVSTYETVVGFVIGTALGYAIGVALWWNESVKRILEPYLVVLNSLPKIALGPLIILWFGTGNLSIIVMAVIISVIITAINMLTGFCETDANKVLLMRAMHASRLQIFVKLVAPANVPTLMSTLKINVGMAWVGSIMGEYIVSKEGIGYLLVYGAQTYRLDLVMTCTIVLCIMAGLMYYAVALIEKWVLKRRSR